METPERGALKLVWLVAAVLLVWGGLELLLDLAPLVIAAHQHQPVPAIKVAPGVIKSLPLLLGLAILFRSKAIAKWISDRLDL